MKPYKNIAVIGSGISGLLASYLLQEKYKVTLFEQNAYLGGHTHTIDIERDGNRFPVNTGFIVFNDWTYPHFIRLMQHLGVESEPSSMSFSVRCSRTGLEYNGTSLNSLFSQRRNLINPRFWHMVKDIIRFNREASDAHQNNSIDPATTLQHFLDARGYSKEFVQHYILPMGAAIWSSPETDMLRFPFTFFARFFHNHGMLSVNERPQWRVIAGGSRTYVTALCERLRGTVHLQRHILQVDRVDNGVVLRDHIGQLHTFDAVVMACHSNQALAMLHGPTQDERRILGAIPYQDNDVVLHTDTCLLPRRKRAWAAWNYHIPADAAAPVQLTYNMNILQNFRSDTTFCVSLNQTEQINPSAILARYGYSHPVFTLDGLAAQTQFDCINGQQHTYYCGAYWFNGFHEDGVNSAIRVARSLGVDFEEIVTPCAVPSMKAS